MNFKKWALTLVACLLVFAALATYKVMDIRASIAMAEAYPEQSETVEEALVSTAQYTPTISVIGEIVAPQRLDLSNEIGGEITSVNFRSGDRVAAGQLLIQLDTTVQEANLDAASARADLARVVHERNLKLIESRVINADQLDRTQAELTSAESEITVLERTIEKLTLRNAEGPVLPALLFRPANTSTGLRLHLHEDGKQAEAGPGGTLEALAGAGETVLAVDLRGLGELQRGKRSSGLKAPFESNGKSATLAYLLGQSLAGMRTEDILACARFASDQWNEGRPVHLTARGEAGIPALHAAALEPQLFASTRLERTLRTWTDVISTSRTRNQQANTVSGALRFYDLPDLVSTLPGNKLVLHEPVDAAGQVEKK